ncbi:MAG: hypothetical protein J3K34DRAFT_526560 [Monoraphidium minutum]|nr:MAG: hypothetical protein J3K34DRAFT_526560 [Monoraphidium minutum]
MATQRSSRRSAVAEQPPAALSAPAPEPKATTSDYVRFVSLQHGGLGLCAAGLGLLSVGYGRGWMHDTHLSLLALAFCLLGLFLHETRPYKREDEFKEAMGVKDE